MNKSKSWIKSLLIVVMALLMVFSLVACDDDKPEKKPGPNNNNGNNTTTDITTGDYFNKLWSLSSKIGAEEIGETDTIALDMGFELSIGTRRSNRPPYELIQQIDLGIELQAVVGRTDATSKDTAIKLNLYDPTKSPKEILTVYLFANDLNNLYLDFAGQSVVVPHTVATAIWNDALGNQTELGNEIANGLNNKFIGEEGKKQSINDIINTFVGTFGTNWNLNTLINDLVKMFDLDLNELFTSDNNMVKMILKALGIQSANDVKDANGNVDLMKLLTSQTLSQAFEVSQAKTGNVTEYKASITKDTLSILSSIFGNNGEISLIFTEENDAIKDFTLIAKLGGFGSNVRDIAVVPEISLKINKLRVQNATEDNKVVCQKEKYNPEIAVNEKLSIKLDGVKYRGADLSGKTFELAIAGKIDMVETDTSKNKTAVNVTIDEISSAGTKHLVQASYKNGIIAASLNEAITFNGKQYKGVKIDVSEKFNVAELIQDGIKEIVYKIAPDKRPAETAADNQSEEKKLTFEQVVKMIKNLAQISLPILSTDNNGIQIDSSKTPEGLLAGRDRSIINIIVQYANIIKENDEEWQKPENKWTMQNRIEEVINNLIYPPYPGEGLQDCLNRILAEFNIDLSDFGAAAAENQTVTPPADNKKIDWKVIGNSVLQILYNIANDLTLEDVSTEDFTKAEIAGIIGKTVEEISDNTLNTWNASKNYIRIIIEALKSKSIVVKADLNNGAHLGVEVKVAGATIEIKESLDLIDDYTFFDVTEIYEQDKEDGKDNLWIDYTWTDNAA